MRANKQKEERTPRKQITITILRSTITNKMITNYSKQLQLVFTER